MDEQKPFLLKIIIDKIPDEEMNKINLLLTGVLMTLFLLNTYLSFIVFSKICDIVTVSYKLAINYFNNDEILRERYLRC